MIISRPFCLAMLKWSGMFYNVVGAIILAVNLPFSKWAFILYLLGSLTWCAVAYLMKEKALLLQNLIYTILNVIGICRWLI